MLLIPIEIGPSPIHGVGVFTPKRISAGTTVWQFDPGLDQRHPIALLELQPPHVRTYLAKFAVISLDRSSYYILGDHTFLINHSETANLAPRDDVVVNGEGVVVAARDIAAGEELTVNYAEIDGEDQARLMQSRPLFQPHLQSRP